MRASRTFSRLGIGALAVIALVPAFGAQPAHADGAGSGTRWVVALGDSYISGEGGRWAGNTNSSSSLTDAGRSTAYFDNATHTAETIPGCHRSTAAEITIDAGVSSLNLACSGAKTSSFTSSSGDFKPGIDFYDSGANQGQALMLQNFAATHNITMVQLSIGGNNFNFADIIQACVVDFLTSPSWWPNYCNDDSSVSANFTSSNVATQTTAIRAAIANIRTAMSRAGYSTAQYTIVQQTYPSPVPPASGFRYSQSGFTRQSTGGCGFWNNDANWANSTALVTINNAVKNAANASGATVLDVAAAFNGRRLCENTVNLVPSGSIANWTSAGASDASEWIEQIRTVSSLAGPYQIQESLHPNWWGEKALRNCVRQAFNGGTPRGGICRRGIGLDAAGEPNMTLG